MFVGMGNQGHSQGKMCCEDDKFVFPNFYLTLISFYPEYHYHDLYMECLCGWVTKVVRSMCCDGYIYIFLY